MPLDLTARRAIGFGSALVAALLATLALALPTPAHASADGCVYSSWNPRSCVQVVGAGLWVDSVRPGVNLLPRGSFHGYFHIWGSGFSHTTGTGTSWNQSWFHDQTFWGPVFHIQRDLPNGSRVCAQAIDSNGVHSPACETIHS